jgi:hypothetical protein
MSLTMSESKKSMEAFLRQLVEYQEGINYYGLPAILLACGSWFYGRVSSDEYDSAKQWRQKHRPAVQECWYNAQSFCLAHEEARYFEGFATFDDVGEPADHAWIVMPDGKVVDFTFEAAERMAKRQGLACDTRDTVYAGVEIPTTFIRQTMLTRVQFEGLADEYFGVTTDRFGTLMI